MSIFYSVLTALRTVPKTHTYVAMVQCGTESRATRHLGLVMRRLLVVGCLTSQQHAGVSHGRMCSNNCTCCHTEIKLQIKLSISPSHSILTPSHPVPVILEHPLLSHWYVMRRDSSAINFGRAEVPITFSFFCCWVFFYLFVCLFVCFVLFCFFVFVFVFCFLFFFFFGGGGGGGGN